MQSYIEAPSLATLITRGHKFSEAEIIELADRLLDLLTYLHQQHPPIIHRDIKPSNILLRNRSGNSIGDVYLVDFGSVQTVAKKKKEPLQSLVVMAIFRSNNLADKRQPPRIYTVWE